MPKFTHIDIEARAQAGKQHFLSGYNCAQSVVAAFADLYPEHDAHTLLSLAASFGGGMGRLRMTCGAVTGMFMLAGLENGNPEPGNMEARTRNYALVQQLGKAFEAENDSMICATLLGLRTGKIESPHPGSRTPEYYRSRPCATLVECACRIYARLLLSQRANEPTSPQVHKPTSRGDGG